MIQRATIFPRPCPHGHAFACERPKSGCQALKKVCSLLAVFGVALAIPEDLLFAANVSAAG